jgi:hypothetical protein
MSIAVAQRSPVREGRLRTLSRGPGLFAIGAATGAVSVLIVIASRVVTERDPAPVDDTAYGVDLSTWSRADRDRRYTAVLKRSLGGVGA